MMSDVIVNEWRYDLMTNLTTLSRNLANAEDVIAIREPL